MEGGSFLFLAFLATSEAVEEDDKDDDDGALGSVSSWPLELVLLDLFIFILRLGEAGAVMGSPPELTSLQRLVQRSSILVLRTSFTNLIKKWP